MSIQNILLLVAGLINLMMSIIVFSRGVKHNKVNRYFSLLTFFNFLWAISLLFARVFSNEMWLFWAQSAYPSALGIALSLLYFSINFPFSISKISKNTNYLIILPAIFFAIIFYIKGIFIIDYEKIIENTSYVLYYNNPVYILFGLYFFILVVFALYNLAKKYSISDGVFKKQISFLLITIVIGLLVGSYFDLVICYFGNFEYVWLGPTFTLLMNFVVFSLIFRIKEK